MLLNRLFGLTTMCHGNHTYLILKKLMMRMVKLSLSCTMMSEGCLGFKQCLYEMAHSIIESLSCKLIEDLELMNLTKRLE